VRQFTSGGGDNRDWPYKSVALPDHGLQKAGMLRIISEELANFTYRSIDSLFGIEENLLAPEPVNDLFTSDKLILSFGQ
jgi:hypothetical protein